MPEIIDCPVCKEPFDGETQSEAVFEAATHMVRQHCDQPVEGFPPPPGPPQGLIEDLDLSDLNANVSAEAQLGGNRVDIDTPAETRRQN